MEQATVAEPLVYVHGYEEIVPGLEKALVGMVAGDKREISVGPEEAFGPHDEEGVFDVGRTDFPDPEKVQVGDEFIAQSPDGDEVAMRVVEILPEGFRMDTNHPLAGQTVRFQVEVQSVRAASEEEISEAQDRLEHHEHHGDEACGCGHEH
ncbi:FKBP-type peptidyl-prolyl cis-trans isomerase SlyD [Chondromyces apiculatus DSM 436]|uniref:Peptidyl-prolyl cis-trans isomerase n=1 Tax=Chondromyces apiculatus DSM 436 TaxID=1192034 RepID=A0A017TB53_9BACT|nr:FKBP-type peptidyl-prolyl cis-trans isomerase SlyD [Chondromyces apiculatus DSM 436]